MNFRRRRRRGPGSLLLAVLLGVLLGGGAKLWYDRTVSTISGTLVDAATQQPLANAEVRWQHLSTTTDAEGRFTLIGVDKELTDVPLVLGGGDYETRRLAVADAAAVVSLQPDTVYGVITDRDRRPIPRARVSAGGATTFAGEDGAFRMDGIAKNPALRVVAPGYKTVNVQPGSRRHVQVTLESFTPKGIWIPFGALHTAEVREGWLKHVDRLQLNTVVLDVMSDRGQVAPAVATDLTRQAGSLLEGGEDLAAIVKDLRARNIYVIARLVVFKDSPIAAARPEWAIRVASNGAPYVDCEGQRWLDPFEPAVWDYKLQQADRIVELGFNEIQFDYIRFPSDCIPGPLAYSRPLTDAAKLDAIEGFLQRAVARLRPKGVALAVDVFGLVTTEDDIGIGQHLETIGKYVDYVSPMVYPSTWANGAFNLDYPPAEPYRVVKDSVRAAVDRLAGSGAVVRPWLQAFDDYRTRRLPYRNRQIADQIRASEEAGAIGWMLWDPFGRYPLEDPPQLGG